MLKFIIGPEDRCYDPVTIEQPRAGGDYIDGTSFISGPVTVCVNGTSYTLCNQGLDDTIASLLCQFQGYRGFSYTTPLFGSDSDFPPSISSHTIGDISCPYSFFSTYNCNFGLDMNGDGCGLYGGRAIITCFRGL